MKQFIIKISIVLGFAITAWLLIVYFNIEKFNDYNYLKLTHENNSLIIGTSRARFAIDPSAFKKYPDMHNFAFTAAASPYGEVYFNAIKRKIKGGENNLFILEVDPYGLSEEKDNEKSVKTDKKNCVGRQIFIDVDPNFEYIFKNETPVYAPLMNNEKINMHVYENGFSVVDNSFSTEKTEAMKKAKLIQYQKESDQNKPSEYRIEYLEKTIDYLQQYGEVYLVNVPIGDKLYNIQKKYWPQHEDKMKEIAQKHGTYYIPLQKYYPQLKTFDEVHVLSEDALPISTFLAHQIDSLKKIQ